MLAQSRLRRDARVHRARISARLLRRSRRADRPRCSPPCWRCSAQAARGVDLSSRVVPAALARDRLFGAVARRAARDVHGRLGCRQLAREPRRHALFAAARCTQPSSSRSACLGCRGAVGHSVARRRVRGARGRRLVDARPPARRRGARAAAGHDAHGRDVARRRGVGCAPTRAPRRGSAGATPPTRPAACWAPSARGSICCALTTSTSRPSSPSRSNLLRRAPALPRLRAASSRRAPRPHRCAALAGSASGTGADLRRDGVVRHDGARGRSALDSPPVVVARRHGLHVRADPGRAAARLGARQRRGRCGRQALRSARRARGVPKRCSASRWPPPRMPLGVSLPYWPIDVTLPTSAAAALQLDLLRTAYVVLPAALLWGASFPLALAAAVRAGEAPRRAVGRLYAANTAGAIVGALATTFVLVAALGSQRTQQLLIVAAAAAARAAARNARRQRDARAWRRAAVGRGSAAGRGIGRARAAARARRLRPLPADARCRRERRVRRRRPDGFDRRDGGAERHVDLSQRRQDAGVDVPAGHALAAHARAT